MNYIQKLTSCCATSFILCSTAFAVEIKSVKIEKVTKAHLCKSLGGTDKDIKITVRHEKKGGERIKIKMYDRVSNGNFVNHRSKMVKSNPSGTTVLVHNFLAPCNRTRTSISSYFFDVSSKSNKKRNIKWFSYDSKNGKFVN